MARQQQIIKNVILLLLAFAFVKCANQMSPPGGEIDKIPPTIISTYPENGTTNFREPVIEISFSEYVNKRNMNEAFFISPLIENNPEFSWTNRTVSIEFPDSFKSNTTYSVIIGTEISDVNNNNKLAAPYILTFSTGDKIDSGKISGKVYADKADGTLMFAYRSDTGRVDIYKQKPTYISQINNKGYYELSGLGSGEYNVYAVTDEFKDLIYNIGDDKIGLPIKSIELNDDIKAVTNLNFFLFKEDTLAPNIQAVTMTDKNHLVVELNEPIDSAALSTDNFLIYDSTSTTSFPIKYWFKTDSRKIEYILCISDSLQVDNELHLHSSNISDKSGNVLLNETTNFIASDKPDTNIITVTKIETPFERSQIDYLSSSFLIYFSDAFDTTNTKSSITMFTPDSTKIPIMFEYINNAMMKVNVIGKLKPKTEYSINFNMNNFVDIAGNEKDTSFIRKLTTVTDLDFSGASGNVKAEKEDNIIVVLQDIKSNQLKKQMKLSENNSFNFDRVLPGEYLVWTFIDSDSNNSYSFGNVSPLKYAEYFKFYPDTLNLRPRWPVGDIEFDLTKN